MPRKYARPPVVEAVCELRFESTSEQWDWTIPGLLYEQIRGQFPKKRQQSLLEVQLQPDEGKLVQQLGSPAARMQFLREDESALIQISPNVLGVNQLRPYPDWPTFRALVLNHLRIYRTIAHPESLVRIGLRYIDRVNFPMESINSDDYLNIRPWIPPGSIPEIWQSFLMQVEIPYEDHASTLRLALGTAQPEPPSKTSIVLDLDMSSEADGVPTLDRVGSWLDTAHDHIEAVFDQAFTEKTHQEIFAEVRE
jgi:uncharacterized protein (TIGR04255 family)